MPEVIIFPVLFMSAAGIIGYALYLRFCTRKLEHQERMAAIEKGAPLPDLSTPPPSPRIYLLRGLRWLFGGIALSIFLAVMSLTTQGPSSLEDRILRSQRLRQAGATEEQLTRVMNGNDRDSEFPIGVALLGLIPAAVGAAYLAYYRTETAQR